MLVLAIVNKKSLYLSFTSTRDTLLKPVSTPDHTHWAIRISCNHKDIGTLCLIARVWAGIIGTGLRVTICLVVFWQKNSLYSRTYLAEQNTTFDEDQLDQTNCEEGEICSDIDLCTDEGKFR